MTIIALHEIDTSANRIPSYRFNTGISPSSNVVTNKKYTIWLDKVNSEI